MRRLVTIFSATVFLLWLLPLGVFIAPSKESILCGSQRAVCLCSGKTTTVKADNVVSGVSVKSSGAPSKEQNPSGGSAHPFILARHFIGTDVLLAQTFSERITCYANPSHVSVEHVPKV